MAAPWKISPVRSPIVGALSRADGNANNLAKARGRKTADTGSEELARKHTAPAISIPDLVDGRHNSAQKQAKRNHQDVLTILLRSSPVANGRRTTLAARMTRHSGDGMWPFAA
jgi:hypothetical protein